MLSCSSSGHAFTDRSASDERPGVLMAQATCRVVPRREILLIRQWSISRDLFALLETQIPVYHAHIVGLHGRSIGVIQLDCIDDESAIKSARRLVHSHDVELWQRDRPVARLDAPPKQICKK
jgi:hypothetical protein